MDTKTEETQALDIEAEPRFEPETKTLLENKTIDTPAGTEVSRPAADAGESAHYEVHVSHYAKYESISPEPTYSQEMQHSLSYAAQTPLMRFFKDLFTVLLHPGAFWKGQATHPATMGQLHFPHLAVLIALRMIAVFTGTALLPETSISRVLLQAVVQGILIFVSIWVFGLAVAGITAIGGGGFHYDRGIRFSGYVMTPTLFVGIISIIPVPYMSTICDLLSMPWAFVVLGAGVLPYLKIKNENAPVITGLFCGLLLCLWGVMPMLIPFLMGLNLW